MQGRCTSSRALTVMVGLAAAIGMTTTATAQDVISNTPESATNRIIFDKVQPDANPGIFRTVREAIDSGLFDIVNPEVEAAGIGRGGSAECVMDAECIQPNDGTGGNNAGGFSSGETLTILQTGSLSEFCASFLFVPGRRVCPPSASNSAFQSGWELNFFDVTGAGDIIENSITAFDTDTLANLTVTNSDGGSFGPQSAFVFVDCQFILGTLPGETSPGFPVSSGDCIALSAKWTGFGGSCGNFFWAHSSDVVNGTATGDGQALFDATGTNTWDVCDYVDEDLMVCVNVLAGVPTCAPDFTVPASNDECDNPQLISCDTTFTQCIRFNTANTLTDPVFDCDTTAGTPDGFTGEFTSWYSVVATSERLQIDTCGIDGDPNFMLQVFRQGMEGEGVGPCNLILETCSDNDCVFGASSCINNAVVGETYIIQVGAEGVFDAVTVELSVNCDPNINPAPVNDDCADATEVPFESAPMPFNPQFATVAGNTRCAGLDAIATDCAGTVSGISGGVWYKATGDGTLWTITQCFPGGGNFDSQINVYCGDCSFGLICLGGNDDGSCAPQSEFSFCTEVDQEYFFLLHGLFDIGDFAVQFATDADFMGGCTNDVPQSEECVFFQLDCETVLGGAPDINESTSADALMEMCGEDINNGCAADPTPMGTMAPYIEGGVVPFTACGTIEAALNNRDLDDYRFTVEDRSILNVTMLAEFEPTLFLFDSDDCDNNSALGGFGGAIGTDLTVGVIVNAGTYVIRCTANLFNGLPCGGDEGLNDYVLQVSATPLGRCCISDTEARGASFVECCVTTQGACDDLGGVFTPAVDCGPITYTVSDQQEDALFSTIIGLPDEVVIDGEEEDAGTMDPFADEDLEFVDIRGDDSELFSGGKATSFDFKFFGELRDDLAICSNGYITFPRGGVGIIDGTPDTIPTPGLDGTTNDIIAPLWRNLDPDVNASPVGLIVLGAVPFRSLVLEYSGVANFAEPETSNTFQVQLFEGTNAIRFLYNDIVDPMPLDGDGMTRTVSIGIENQDGTVGFALDDAEITALNTEGLSFNEVRFYDFTPTMELSVEDACLSAPVCLGDCDGDGSVGFPDIVAMLFSFQMAPPAEFPGCDADESGTVGFPDVVAALFLFGDCP